MRVRSSGRLIGIIALLSVATSCDRKPSFQAKFEPLYRTAKTVQASTAIGLSYQQLGERLQGLATELSIAADRAETPEEKALVAAYLAALEAYKDSHAVWNSKIESYSQVTPDLEPLVAKYKVPVSDGKFDDGAIQAIWQAASGKVDKATTLYYQRASSK
jgi:hypothetical protein